MVKYLINPVSCFSALVFFNLLLSSCTIDKRVDDDSPREEVIRAEVAAFQKLMEINKKRADSIRKSVNFQRIHENKQMYRIPITGHIKRNTSFYSYRYLEGVELFGACNFIDENNHVGEGYLFFLGNPEISFHITFGIRSLEPRRYDGISQGEFFEIYLEK